MKKKNKLIKQFIKVPKWWLKDFSEIEKEDIAKQRTLFELRFLRPDRNK